LRRWADAGAIAEVAVTKIEVASDESFNFVSRSAF
jgi:hypothetical protein